MELSSNSLLSL